MDQSQKLTFVLAENEDGKFFVLPNDVLGQHLLRGQRWEPYYTRVLPFVLPQGSTAIDVGASIGYTSVVMAKTVGPSGNVFAFEPLQIVFEQLRNNINLNGLTNIYPSNLAIGHADEVTVSMVAVDYNEKDINTMNTCIGIGGDFVKMKTLDSFNFTDVSLLKIDVQGCEPYVLRGAASTIERNRPVLFLEIEEPQLVTQNSSSVELIMQVLALDYILVKIVEGFVCDHICVPREKRQMLPSIVQSVGLPTEIYVVKDGSLQQISAV